MTDTITATADDQTSETLTLASACDACGYSGGWPISRAYVLVRLTSGGTLTLCGHHYAQHEATLVPLIDSMDDDRSYLTVKRDSGFNA